jgi:hypothetical protein
MEQIVEDLHSGVPRFIDELSLFASLCMAQLIVWRTDRRHRKEDESRRRNFRLVRGDSDAKEPREGGS